MSIAHKTQVISANNTIIAENQQKVYEAGKEEGYKTGKEEGYEAGKEEGYEKGYKTGETAEYNSFWDNAFQNGKREYFAYAFGSIFNDDNFKPNRKIIPKSKAACSICEHYKNGACNIYGAVATATTEAVAEGIFQSSSITKLSEDIIDWQCVPKMTAAFSSSKITQITGINAKNCITMLRLFKWCSLLKKAEFVNYSQVINWIEAFYNCRNLEHVRFFTDYDENGKRTESIRASIDFGDCSKLTFDSIINIMEALSDDVSRTVTLSLAAVNKAFESDVGANDGSTTYDWLNVSTKKTNWKVVLR